MEEVKASNVEMHGIRQQNEGNVGFGLLGQKAPMTDANSKSAIDANNKASYGNTSIFPDIKRPVAHNHDRLT